MSTCEFTICTVCSNNEDYLNLNSEISRINVPYRWLVALEEPKLRITQTKLKPCFEVYPVPNLEMTAIDGVAQNSVQHGTRLNLLFEKVDTRFVLFLDPDFFIFFNVSTILGFLRESVDDLSFFGAPYHESTTNLLRNFPVAYCLFVDLDKIPRKDIDFSPGYGKIRSEHYPDVGYKLYSKYHQMDSHLIVLPSVPGGANFVHTKNSLAAKGLVYDNPRNEVGTKIDEFWFGNTLFGVHTRAKLNQQRNKNKARIDHQLGVVRMINDYCNRTY